MRDAVLGAFSVFFMQSPSFLAHQQAMQDKHQCNNATSLFGLVQIPSDQQIRNLLDPVTPEQLTSPFWALFDLLEERGELTAYRSFAGQWLVSLDGTQCFGSTKMHCERCTVSMRNGTEYYAQWSIVVSTTSPKPISAARLPMLLRFLPLMPTAMVLSNAAAAGTNHPYFAPLSI